jgi:hypothetical protein
LASLETLSSAFFVRNGAEGGGVGAKFKDGKTGWSSLKILVLCSTL